MYKRIHIVGPAGSGKTYLGKKLAKKLKYPLIVLDDDVHWEPNNLNVRRPAKERDKLLKKAIATNTWIIEGTYTKPWTLPSFEKADIIIFIEAPMYTIAWRILTREQDTPLTHRLNLIRWSAHWNRVKERLGKFKKKIKTFKSADEAFEYLTKA